MSKPIYSRLQLVIKQVFNREKLKGCFIYFHGLRESFFKKIGVFGVCGSDMNTREMSSSAISDSNKKYSRNSNADLNLEFL